mgnify:CR=1 FL=1
MTVRYLPRRTHGGAAATGRPLARLLQFRRTMSARAATDGADTTS